MAGAVVWAITGIQVGPSGKTYASAEVQCGVNPVMGMAPMVQAGLYNPKKNATATVSLNGVVGATDDSDAYAGLLERRIERHLRGQCRRIVGLLRS